MLKPTSEIIDQTTWVRGIGAHAGKMAKDLGPGDVIVLNYGRTAEVTGIVIHTASEIAVRVRRGALEYEKLYRVDEVVPIQGYGSWSVMRNRQSRLKRSRISNLYKSLKYILDCLKRNVAM